MTAHHLISQRRIYPVICTAVLSLLISTGSSRGEIKTIIEHNSDDFADVNFKFKNVPRPTQNDAAASAKFAIVDGEQDPASGGLGKLNDGKMPTDEDQADENFFFRPGTDGGRIVVDLNRSVEIAQVNTYSWHPSSRGPQVYVLYASDGSGAGFDAQPKGSKSPESCGWKLITKVDTRSASESGGQFGVSIFDTTGLVGSYRYLLFACSKTESEDPFGNTFFSEIDVIDKNGPAPVAVAQTAPVAFVTHSVDGTCEIDIDTTGAPDLKDWAEQKLAPALAGFYPKVVAALSSEGYVPPKRFTVTIKPISGVAFTSGTKVVANSDWLKNELAGEAVGSLIHEEVHVIQLYSPKRHGRNAPGWLIEGIPDYIRWYLYEPQSNGAKIGRRSLEKAHYNGSYRVSANFLNFVVQKYDKDLIQKVNSAMRQGKYSDDLWKDYTSKTLTELEQEWKAQLQKELDSADAKK